jgi:hypothetical protein
MDEMKNGNSDQDSVRGRREGYSYSIQLILPTKLRRRGQGNGLYSVQVQHSGNDSALITVHSERFWLVDRIERWATESVPRGIYNSLLSSMSY